LPIEGDNSPQSPPKGSGRPSIAARMAAMFALSALIAFSLICSTLYLVLNRELSRHETAQIQSRMQDMRYMLTHARAPGIAERARAKIEALTPPDGRNRYWMFSEDPEFRYGQGLEEVLAATRAQSGVAEWLAEGRRVHVLSEDLAATPTRPAVRLMVGSDYEPFASTLRRFAWSLVILTLAGSCVVALAGYWVARLGLLPLLRLSEEAQQIEPGKPAQRLRLPALPKELADLGESFNSALDRLDDAYRHLATFNDNVAHELRTPLANLIGLTQVALSRERSDAQLREVLASNLEELERLRSIVADMLFLARAEQGARASELIHASMSEEVGRTLEFMELLLEEASVHVRVRGDAAAPAQVALLRRALTNLVHNAIQHSPKGSEILIEIQEDEHFVEVSVQNPGLDIPAEHMPHLFDRFYRVDESRSNSGESHGLGLAIVKAVAHMHQGMVFASSSLGLTRVGLTIRR